MKGHGEKLSRKQESAIAALLSEGTMKAAAASAGVSEATLWRWSRLPEFQARLRGARRQVLERAVSELQAASSEAVEALRRNLGCANPAAEIKAAQIILDQAMKGAELLEMQGRIEQLEAMLAADGR